MKGGAVIPARKVISCIGAYHTFVNLIPSSFDHEFLFLSKARDELTSDRLKSSPAHAVTFLALKGTAQSLELPKANWWVQGLNRFSSICISFPSAKDPSWKDRFPNLSICEIAVEAPSDLIERYSRDPSQSRSTDYLKRKDEFAQQMCGVLFRFFPQLKDKVEFHDVCMPLSAESFLGSRKSGAYGLACTPARYQVEWLKPCTDIKNLFLGAQDVVSCGVAGSQMGGIIAASAASLKTLFYFAKDVYASRPITEAPNQWSTIQDEVDSGGVVF